MAVLLVGPCWWYWPRGDARFVGKWEVRIEDSTSQPARTVVLVLKANGSGETYANGRRGGDFAWRVQGKVYLQGSPTSYRLVNEAIARCQSLLPNSVRKSLPQFSERNIVSVGTDEIELSTGSGGRAVFKRLPE